VLHDDRGVVGYGYDRCFKKHCGAQHRKQGVLLDYVIEHGSGESTIAAAQPKDLGGGGSGSGNGSSLQAAASATARARSSYVWAQKQALALEKALVRKQALARGTRADQRDVRWATRTCESRHDACGCEAAHRSHATTALCWPAAPLCTLTTRSLHATPLTNPVVVLGTNLFSYSAGRKDKMNYKVCDVEHADLSVEAHPDWPKRGQDKYPACWHSCCCYNVRTQRTVPRTQWTLSDKALNRVLEARAARIGWLSARIARAARMARLRVPS
jgi:hypothetical protein